uniref:Uncharacterized protein n=1 Tax=viral metagenome TaxID=1070528 RepID=A0A6M3LIL0_9ZZZZ
MADNTKIEWAEATWSPITGCTPISEGCQNCYAKRMATRLKGRFGYPKDDPFRVTFHPERLYEPLKWKKPRHIFVVSMGDLFHEDVEKEWLDTIFHTMACNPRHTFLILTKRPKNMLDYWMGEIRIPNAPPGWTIKKAGKPYSKVLDHIWLGVTAENQQRADERIPILLQIPAAKHFVSIEPMLSEIDLAIDIGHGVGDLAIDRLNWVILGGETGPRARPMHPDWVRSVRDQCQAAGVPFWFKSWGSRPYPPNTDISYLVDAGYDPYGTAKGNNCLDGRKWEEKP